MLKLIIIVFYLKNSYIFVLNKQTKINIMITTNDLNKETIQILKDGVKQGDMFTIALRMLNNDFQPSDLINFFAKQFKINKDFCSKVVYDALTCID